MKNSDTKWSHWRSHFRLAIMEFMRIAPQPIGESPRVPRMKRVQLRAKLIAEECFETVIAMVGNSPEMSYNELWELIRLDHSSGEKLTLFSAAKSLVKHGIEITPVQVDMVGFADGCIDIIYVTIGAMIEFGIEEVTLFDEVHRANLCKFVGERVWGADGKLLKPEGWKPPDIRARLIEQGWDENNVGDLFADVVADR